MQVCNSGLIKSINVKNIFIQFNPFWFIWCSDIINKFSLTLHCRKKSEISFMLERFNWTKLYWSIHWYLKSVGRRWWWIFFRVYVLRLWILEELRRWEWFRVKIPRHFPFKSLSMLQIDWIKTIDFRHFRAQQILKWRTSKNKI
jgi:hypothetical protein